MLKDHKALELDKILLQLANETTCPDAAELAQKIEPDTDIRHVERLLQETDDAFVLMAKYGAPSFYGMTNVTNALRRAEAGGVLNLAELLSVAATLRAIRSVSDWRKKSESVKTALDYRFETLQPNKFIEDRISMTVVSEEEVADTASVALAAIRRKIRAASLRVREQLDKMIRSQTYQKYLQEAIVTQRGGRYVVPVKAEFRNEVKGLIHDSSGSGATVFIEPIGVVEANNEIRVLRSDEKDEIDRILTELSREIGEFADGIIQSYRAAVELNLIFAKGQLAYKMKATVPKLNQEGRIAIKSARHPLIDKNKVVPTDLYLGSDFDALIVTGPNTGGKTVTLKTLGLLCLMAQCGLHIPADDGSVVRVFDRVLADVGDEQSIEQSLSTFSAHMANIVQILQQADEQSLLLFDELGAGTDPVEGAALAIAVIQEVRSRGALTAATTHYAELKTFAMTTAGVENASCEFDVQTLRPTYRLLIGIPGKSNAFAISRRLGLDEHVIEAARAQMDSESVRFEDVLTQLEEKRQRLERAQSEADRLWQQREEDARKARTFREQMEKAKENARSKGEAEAKRIVREAQAKVDAIFAELDELRRQQQKRADFQQMNDARANVRRGLNEAEALVRSRESDSEPIPAPSRPIRVGDQVELPGVNRAAEVLTVNADGSLVLQAGKMKMTVKHGQVRLLETAEEIQKKKKQQSRAQSSSPKIQLASRAASELDIRGYETLEAESVVDNYIDSAVMAKLGSVTIIHGKGTGALRKAVHEILRRNKAVKSFRLGRYGEGEAGVTIVELK